mmetsp:Transcript_908/g.2894  ORF Transcript_908/g.2894 Transcript_908/m.2894 type:complete len:226 (+) Transcript_908:598-1275(+)
MEDGGEDAPAAWETEGTRKLDCPAGGDGGDVATGSGAKAAATTATLSTTDSPAGPPALPLLGHTRPSSSSPSEATVRRKRFNRFTRACCPVAGSPAAGFALGAKSGITMVNPARGAAEPGLAGQATCFDESVWLADFFGLRSAMGACCQRSVCNWRKRPLATSPTLTTVPAARCATRMLSPNFRNSFSIRAWPAPVKQTGIVQVRRPRRRKRSSCSAVRVDNIHF